MDKRERTFARNGRSGHVNTCKMRWKKATAAWQPAQPGALPRVIRIPTYRAMLMDPLHQMVKGMVDHTLQWCLKHVKAQQLCHKRKHGGSQVMNFKNRDGPMQVDDRSQAVLPYTGLKRFKNFSTVKQWSGNEQDSIARQLLPVIVPLPKDGWFEPVMLFTRSVLNSWMLPTYRSHDDDTLRYMKRALYVIDKLKSVFGRFWTNKRQLDEDGRSNFPKFHVISHYTDICHYGTLDGTNTCYAEPAHKYLVKEPYDRTNKRTDFEI